METIQEMGHKKLARYVLWFLVGGWDWFLPVHIVLSQEKDEGITEKQVEALVALLYRTDTLPLLPAINFNILQQYTGPPRTEDRCFCATRDACRTKERQRVSVQAVRILATNPSPVTTPSNIYYPDSANMSRCVEMRVAHL